MTFPSLRSGTALLSALLAATLPLRAEPGHIFPPLTRAEKDAIAAAAPARPRATPAKPRAILVFYRTEGFVHTSIPYANEALREIGARSGAYRADFSEDMAVFTPARLAAYDAVVFQNTTALAFSDPAQRRALLDFVRSGKGLVGIHAATDNFYTWPEAQAMIGGLFRNHPWKSIDTVGIKVDDPDSPLVAAFGGKGFWLREEIYEIVGPYGRDRQRVLLSVDLTKATDWRPPEKLTRTDADFPIAWVKAYGKGRVFYTSLGHNTNLFSVPELLQFYLDGIQFALGDLPADATLPLKPVAAVLAQVPGIPLQDRGYRDALDADAFDRLATYNFGPDRVPAVAIDLYLRTKGPKVYPAVERSLLALLARPGLKGGARDYAIRTLGAIGSPASVPALAALVGDPVFGSTAVMALFSIPGPASDAALLSALDSAKPPVLLAVINAAGRRRLPGAIPRLAQLVSSPEPQTGSAALNALGDIGTAASLRVLGQLAPPEGISGDRAWAELNAAATVVAEGRGADRAQVEAVYGGILESPGPDPVRIAALRGLARMGGPAAPGTLRAALGDARPRVRAAAANLLGEHADRAALRAMTARFPALEPSLQIVLLSALDARRDSDAFPLFEAGLASSDGGVRTAALRGLGDIANPAALAPLVSRLEGEPGDAAAAVESLGQLRVPGVYETLVAALPSASPAKKAAIFQVLTARVDPRVFPLAVAAVGDPTAAVRTAAFSALAATARRGDLPTVLALLPRTRTAAERRSMERALLEVVRAAPDPDTVVDAINGSLEAARGPARYSLLAALTLAGTDHARGILAGLLRSASAEDRREVIRAISGARNPNLDGLLVDAAKAARSPAERILALQAYLDMLAVPSGWSNEEIAAGYATAWSLADRVQERDAIIAALRHLNTNATDAQIARLQASRRGP
jgi:type 1 glutamine amidotransferase/HEAT repeat protein